MTVKSLKTLPYDKMGFTFWAFSCHCWLVVLLVLLQAFNLATMVTDNPVNMTTTKKRNKQNRTI